MVTPGLVVIPRIFLFPQACHNLGNECSFPAATGQQSAFLHPASIVLVVFFFFLILILLSVIVDLYVVATKRDKRATCGAVLCRNSGTLTAFYRTFLTCKRSLVETKDIDRLNISTKIKLNFFFLSLNPTA